MEICDIAELQKSAYQEPSFFVEYCNVGRGVKGKHAEGPRIVSTESLVVWKILGNQLLPVEFAGVFFSHETYLVQWTFNYILSGNELNKETIFFWWKGLNATKGLSPLPENFDNDTAVVHRIVQWSEPAVFFQIFPKPVIVLDGKFGNFNANVCHMFIVLGELPGELHLTEVPFLRKNLRSRGVFLLVVPGKESIYIWRGLKATKELFRNVQGSELVGSVKDLDKSWNAFNLVEIQEKEEDELFQGDIGSYFHVTEECNFSPRLFYLHTITGNFMATEVEYPLRNKGQVAAFPFLQSHLHTADQPGYFLLDNSHEIWLISNELKVKDDLYDSVTALAGNYAKLREQSLNRHVIVKFVTTDINIIEFTNIFPYWN